MTPQEIAKIQGMADHDLLVEIAVHVGNLQGGFKECRTHCDTVQADLYMKMDKVKDSVTTLKAQATLLGTIAGFVVTAVFWVLNRLKI